MMKKLFSRSNAFLLLFLVTAYQWLDVKAQGPINCPGDPDTQGFTTIKDLNVFMLSVWTFINEGGQLEPPFYFTLCPNTVFSDDYIYPILNDTWIICGDSGLSSNNCTLTNETHIIILPHDYEEAATESLEQVNFFGLTMKESSEVSVAGYGSPEAWGYFYDCHWESNNGDFAIHVEALQTDIDDGMFIQLEECSFKNSEHSHSTIFNRHGYTLVTNTLFENVSNEWGTLVSFYHYVTSVYDSTFKNTSNYFTVSSIGGYTNLYDSDFIGNNNGISTVFVSEISGLRSNGTSFVNNKNGVGTVLLSSDSFLLLNRRNSGSGNIDSLDCNGIWTQESNITCTDISCPGECCAFDDDTCDLSFTESPTPALGTGTGTFFPTISPLSSGGMIMTRNIATFSTIFSIFYALL